MTVREAYNDWSTQYDIVENKTRDLEGLALRSVLNGISFSNCLEVGCGTGKNTAWLLEKAQTVTAVDFSGKMLLKAKEKIPSPNIKFIQADVTKAWLFASSDYDLICFSLVLEHISTLNFVFSEAAKALKTGGYVYLGELHPYKQYAGSKARFETSSGTQVVECYNHHLSDFIEAGRKSGLSVLELQEFFDNDDRAVPPRILTILFKKV